jgi:SAM-dependent methyltransferase
MSPPTDDPGAWWTTLYDETVADLLLVRRDPQALSQTLDFLTRNLHLTPGATIYDQCCGIGSLAVPLSLRGHRVIGADQSASYIARARKDAAARNAPCEFRAADAFSFLPEVLCDAAFNWGIGFGNAATDEQNLVMLSRAHAALRPGGWFALEYHNVPRILQRFQPVLLHRARREDGEAMILRESELDLPAGLLRQRWTIMTGLTGMGERAPGERLVRDTAARLYLPDALGALLRRAGFTDVSFYGDVAGSRLTLESPRCICIARRP